MKTLPTLPTLMTTKDVARACQVSPRTVWRWLAEGRLPKVALGRSVRVRVEDLQRLLDGATTSAAATAGGGDQ